MLYTIQYIYIYIYIEYLYLGLELPPVPKALKERPEIFVE